MCLCVYVRCCFFTLYHTLYCLCDRKKPQWSTANKAVVLVCLVMYFVATAHFILTAYWTSLDFNKSRRLQELTKACALALLDNSTSVVCSWDRFNLASDLDSSMNICSSGSLLVINVGNIVTVRALGSRKLTMRCIDYSW